MSRNDSKSTGTGELSPSSRWKCTVALLVELPTFSISSDNHQFYKYLEDEPEFMIVDLRTLEDYYDKYGVHESNFVIYPDEIKICWVEWDRGLIKLRKFSRLY